jgi:hypothetical protein
MQSWESTCQVCGKTKSHWDMAEVRSVYRVLPDVADVCYKCGEKMNSHVDYYGKKKQKDKDAVKSILLNGFAVNQRYSALMNAGYAKHQRNRD